MSGLPEPVYDEDGITLYQGDCRDILPHLSGVDLVLTDPPYGVGFDYGGEFKDRRRDYCDWLWPIIESAERCTRATAYVGVFQAARNARLWRDWFPREWQLLAIPKTFGQLGRSFIGHMTDYVLLWPMADGPRLPETWQPPGFRNWFLAHTEIPRRGVERLHPCPRPLPAMRYLVSGLCPPGGLVLDTFAGSGSTLVAARLEGRRAIGIEIDPTYCQVAIDRLRQRVLPLWEEAS